MYIGKSILSFAFHMCCLTACNQNSLRMYQSVLFNIRCLSILHIHQPIYLLLSITFVICIGFEHELGIFFFSRGGPHDYDKALKKRIVIFISSTICSSVLVFAHRLFSFSGCNTMQVSQSSWGGSVSSGMCAQGDAISYMVLSL